MTNTCRANPNTSPDSPLDGESEEVFGFALHLFVKALGVMGDESTLVYFGVICVQRVGAFYRHMKVNAFGIICSKGLTIYMTMQLYQNSVECYTLIE